MHEGVSTQGQERRRGRPLFLPHHEHSQNHGRKADSEGICAVPQVLETFKMRTQRGEVVFPGHPAKKWQIQG